jgi:hypothetical protein
MPPIPTLPAEAFLHPGSILILLLLGGGAAKLIQSVSASIKEVRTISTEKVERQTITDEAAVKAVTAALQTLKGELSDQALRYNARVRTLTEELGRCEREFEEERDYLGRLVGTIASLNEPIPPRGPKPRNHG